MEYRVITPPAAEPVTLTEAKQHLRATSETFAGDIEVKQSISPGLHAIAPNYGLVGASVDVVGRVAVASLVTGAFGEGGSVAAKLQHSDEGTHWEDFASFAAVSANAAQELEYTGIKRYVRAVATVAGAACNLGANIVTETGEKTDETHLSNLITAAREYCENRLGRSLCTQTLEMMMDCFPSRGAISLLRPPVQSVLSVKYKDYAGVETTLAADVDYLVDTDSDVGRIALPYGKSWPSFSAYPVNPIRIQYMAGYSDTNPIPKTIKQAMLLLIGHWYANREAVGNVGGQIEFAVSALLNMYRCWWF